MNSLAPNADLVLKVQRDGKTETVTAKLGKLPEAIVPDQPPARGKFPESALSDIKAGAAIVACGTMKGLRMTATRLVLGAEPLLKNTAADYAPKPDYRSLTKFENRGIKLGHGVWDLVFTRV